MEVVTKLKDIDYTGLSTRIVEQAFASANLEMTEEQKQKLIQDKFERASAMQNALKGSPLWHTDS